MFGIVSFSQAPFSTLPVSGNVVTASAAITADATVSASGIGFRTSAASINATATVTVTTSGAKRSHFYNCKLLKTT